MPSVMMEHANTDSSCGHPYGNTQQDEHESDNLRKWTQLAQMMMNLNGSSNQVLKQQVKQYK